MATRYNVQTLGNLEFIINLETEEIVCAYDRANNAAFILIARLPEDSHRIDTYLERHGRAGATLYPGLLRCEMWRLHSSAISSDRAHELWQLTQAAGLVA